MHALHRPWQKTHRRFPERERPYYDFASKIALREPFGNPPIPVGVLLITIELRSMRTAIVRLTNAAKQGTSTSRTTLIQLHIGNVTASCRYSFHGATIFDSARLVKMNSR
jgi:hypothetical protein